MWSNLLAPDIVVLGGGLVEAMPELYVEKWSGPPASGPRRRSAKMFKVAAAKLGDDAVVRGAAAWAQAMTQE